MIKKVVLLSAAVSLTLYQPAFADDLNVINGIQDNGQKVQNTVPAVNNRTFKDRFFRLIRLERGKIQKTKELPEKKEEMKTEGQTIQFGEVKQDQVYSQSNLQEDIKNSSSSIDIITRKELQTLHTPALRDAVTLLPSISSYQYGSTGNQSPLYIRGWKKALLTLDGMRINDAMYNRAYLDNFLTDGVERVEVIRGPQGTVHGTQSQGGIIGVFTRQGSGAPSFEFESGMGTYATFRENFAFQGGNESADYYLGVTRLDSNGGSKTTPDGKVKHDGYGNFTVSSNLGKRLLNGKAELRNTVRYVDAHKQLGNQGLGYPSFDPNNDVYNCSIFENLTFSHAPTEWYDYNVRFGLLDSRYKNIDAPDPNDGFFDAPYGRIDNTRLMLLTQHNLKYKKLNTFTVGYNLEYNKFNKLDTISKDYASNDVYFNDVINIKDIVFIRGGTRLVSSSEWGTYATPNLSGAVVLPTFKIPNSYTKFRSSYGYSVYTPTAIELYDPIYGNPNLQPEKLNGWDVGMVQSFFNDKANFEFGYFRNDFHNLIGYDPFTWQQLNYERARTYGWESSIKVNPLPGLSASVNYTYTDGQQNGQDLTYLPRNRWNYLLSYSPNHRYNIYWKAISASSRPASPNKLKGFFDMSIGTTINLFKIKDAQVYGWAQLNNLFNQRYQEVKGYPHPGIHFLAGIFIKRAI